MPHPPFFYKNRNAIVYKQENNQVSDTNSDSMRPPARPPNCLKCAHFRITWDPVFPRSCEIFAIKCGNLPSHEVFRATGANCPSFRQKEGLK
ncbi:hypothetical protein AGMMS50293_06940 [Spirochaetia bacterium]|nr:hypothetical protein AGMMS50293_06940 [Spirochaetia bacterium]